MKKTIALLLIVAAVFGCKKDEETTDTSTNTPEYNDQNLQGKIEGVLWEYVSGKFSMRKISDSEYGYSVTMYPQRDSSLCSSGLKKWDKILFTCPITPGRYELNLDFNNPSGARTVTLYSEKEGINNIATQGSYEIVTADTSKGILEIKMNVSADSENSVNGKATLTYCN
ncbi:MAG: hypothetical protein CL840_07325 [Crocinitomicaceae bacterium]|nr:hypothetical protein [Crocinitomicaceae bacterium]|tara:strand:- start:1241 stop:1750 length:510 start_codon:yes stop_codon:yes gene_type:complete